VAAVPRRGRAVGERGARRDPVLWAARLDVAADDSDAGERARPPRAVRVGTRLGALLGALPGLWLGVRDAVRASAQGSTVDAGWALVMGIALVGGAGLLLGIALGAGVGLLVTAAGAGRER
jgi:hypothetical protein